LIQGRRFSADMAGGWIYLAKYALAQS